MSGYKNGQGSRAPVAHACNPNYSGGWRFEASSGKIVCKTVSQNKQTKNSSQKRAGGVAQGVSPEFKPQ
jgi:hypothetical protein